MMVPKNPEDLEIFNRGAFYALVKVGLSFEEALRIIKDLKNP